MHPARRRPHRGRTCAPALALLVALLAAGCGEPGGVARNTDRPATSAATQPTPTPTPTAPLPTPTATPTPTAVPTPTPLPAGLFRGSIAVRPGADIRTGPGTDQAVVAQEPFGATDLFDGWYRRGDDPPLPDFQSGMLETWSQDWFRLADHRGWIHSAQVAGFPPAAMAPVAWMPPPVRDVPIPTDGRHRIVISITRQHLWAFAGSRLVLDTVIGTGRGELPTLTGTYHVFYKTSPFYMASDWPRSSPYWYAPVWVQYVMEFIGGGYFIHDAPWRTRWGPGANLVAGSHGCVNVPMPIMATLYRWTANGDEVVVQNR